jgi:penicillin-binding protein 1A
MGIDSSLSTNPAIILGGLKRGVTPLEMAYAYTTLANGGNRVTGSMASRGVGKGPVAIARVEDPSGDLVEDQLGASGKDEVSENQVISSGVADTAVNILNTVVTRGTGRRASFGEYAWGKTGTTDSNIDAWFVGSTEYATAAVWVGYPDGATAMETEFGGAPVDGGTIPALIWNDVMRAVFSIYEQDLANREAERLAKEAADEAESGGITTPQTELPPEPTEEPAPDEGDGSDASPAKPEPPASGATESTGGGISADG